MIGVGLVDPVSFLTLPVLLWFSLVKYKRKCVTVHVPGEITSMGFSTTIIFPAAAAAPPWLFSPAYNETF